MQNLNAYEQLSREMQFVVRNAVARAADEVNSYVELEMDADEASKLTHSDYTDQIVDTAFGHMCEQVDPLGEVGVSGFLYEAIGDCVLDQVRIRAVLRHL